ncbi:MAG: Gfo/Idh/MocA family oxidoreductase [Clostridia bacterium]|nr:Gfo/Idh/MocA family oxidoreductase [Clostridia bacterium]
MNIGLIGFGSMGKTHAYAIHNMKYFYSSLSYDAKITAVCAAHYENAMTATERYSLGEARHSEDDIIGDPTIDIIDICTPNIYHYETLKKAIAAGKHIYCEKPLCVTAAQAEEIAGLAEKAGIKGQIVFNNRFMTPPMRAKQMIESGQLGRILSFRCDYLHSSCMDVNKNAGWKQNRDICGGGVLFDLGSHALDMAVWLCGRIKSVSGRGQIAFPARRGIDGNEWNTNADEAFYMICETESEAVGTVSASKIAIGTNDDLSFEIYGERGALKYSLMEPEWLWYYDGARAGGELGGIGGFTKIECGGRYPTPGGAFPSPKAPVGWLRGHVESYHSFLTAVAEDKTTNPSFKDASHIQLVMERAYESNQNGGGMLTC